MERPGSGKSKLLGRKVAALAWNDRRGAHVADANKDDDDDDEAILRLAAMVAALRIIMVLYLVVFDQH